MKKRLALLSLLMAGAVVATPVLAETTSASDRMEARASA
jgi:hypothetical protein